MNWNNVQFYLKITPVRDNNPINTRPILTRLTSPTNSNEIPLNLKILGEKDIGFEVKVKLQYENNNQEFTCDGSHQFYHQRTGESGNPTALDVTLKALNSGASKNLLQDASLLNTSCDTHGGGYEDITLTLDFNTVKRSSQFGTVILCQMNTYCRSEGDDGGYSDSRFNANCTPEKGRWQRCYNILPRPDSNSDQEWTFKSKLESKQVLVLQFNDMKANRRYDLNIAEFAIDGEKLRHKNFIFYIDERRPYIRDRQIIGDNVGIPTDNIKDREYVGPLTSWKKPVDSAGKWLQCNKEPVDFEITIEDQFTHNLKNCDISWKREDGSGSTSLAPITSIS